MPVITNPNILKILKKNNEKRIHNTYNKIITRDYPSNKCFIDLTGKDFGYIHVDGYCGKTADWKIYYYCTCNYCGLSTIISANNLKKGYSTCGCFKYKHNDAYDKLYHEYQSILNRCYNPNNQAFSRYGGRGIKVDDQWLGPNGYENFKIWSYENGYYINNIDKCISLDRQDNDGNYSPTNCRWATMKLQSNNRSTSNFILYNNHVFSIEIWAEIANLPRSTFLNRLYHGWTIEEALRTPSKCKKGEDLINIIIPNEYNEYDKYEEFKNKDILNTCNWSEIKYPSNDNNNNKIHPLLYNNHIFSIKEWAEIANLPRSTFVNRIMHGWNIEEALRTPAGLPKGTNMIDIIIPDAYKEYDRYEIYKNKGMLYNYIN